MLNKNVTWVVEVMSGLLAASWCVGDCQLIEDFLGGLREFDALSAEERREALISIIHAEVELRRRSGQSPAGAEYADRFPEVGRVAIDDVMCLPALPSGDVSEVSRPHFSRMDSPSSARR